jgi:hypothetical protein
MNGSRHFGHAGALLRQAGEAAVGMAVTLRAVTQKRAVVRLSAKLMGKNQAMGKIRRAIDP